MNYKEIIGYENYIIFKTGKIYSKRSKRFLKPSLDTHGYYELKLGRGNRKKLHRLLALHFIDNPENKPVVDHIDRCRTNNNLDNLRWATNSENNINTGVKKNNKLKEKNICETTMAGNNYYSIEIMRNNKRYRKLFNKNKCCLEEVVAYRDAMIKDINNNLD